MAYLRRCALDGQVRKLTRRAGRDTLGFMQKGLLKFLSPVSNILGAAIADAIKEPDVRERFSRLALDPFFVGPREFNARALRDNARWKEVAEDAGD